MFIRCDGKVFVSDTGTAANVNKTDTSNAVYGGWGRAPLGFIPGDAGMEISFTDAMFYEDMYSLLSTGTAFTSDTDVWDFGTFEVKTGLIVELPFEVNVATGGTIIEGKTQATTLAANKYTIAYDSTNKKTTITFNTGEFTVGDEVDIAYQRRVATPYGVNITSENGTARGALYLTYRVMSAGTDCTQAAAKGLYHVIVPRVMVTTPATLDTSRGSAATPQVTFSAIDSHRADGLWYRTVYEPLSSTGAVSTDYTGTVTYDKFVPGPATT